MKLDPSDCYNRCWTRHNQNCWVVFRIR